MDEVGAEIASNFDRINIIRMLAVLNEIIGLNFRDFIKSEAER